MLKGKTVEQGTLWVNQEPTIPISAPANLVFACIDFIDIIVRANVVFACNQGEYTVRPYSEAHCGYRGRPMYASIGMVIYCKRIVLKGFAMTESIRGDTIMSLFGRPLAPPEIPNEARQRNQTFLAEAKLRYEQEPSLENTIWYGRRAAYLYQFERALAIYTAGIQRFPHAHQLYRHRGHRYISTRQLARAIADFEHAAELARTQPVEIEPDGIPNSAGTPLSNSHFNIWYHLGLAYYLTHAFEQAAAAYQTCLEYVYNDDCLTATIDWGIMTYRRMGMFTAAEQLLERIPEQLTLVENDGYHRRILMYKGILAPSALLAPSEAEDELTLVTEGYGVGNWYFTSGDIPAARAVYQRLLATQSRTAFGYIAAEVDLYSMHAKDGMNT